MSFLFRMTFWLAVVFALLPNSGSRPAAPHVRPSGTQGVAAAASSAEPRQFWPQRPDACADGPQAFAQVCRNIYRFLTEPDRQRRSKSTADAARPSQHTLTSTDVLAPWRGPAPRKEPVARRSI
jgi:hypothetical protein